VLYLDVTVTQLKTS